MFKKGKVNLVSSGGAQYRSQVRTFLNFCADTRKAFSGTVQPNELLFLQELVHRANSIEGPIIEIGTLFGFTTQCIADWKTHEKLLVTVDDFSWNPIGFDRQTHQAFTNRVIYYLIHHENTTLQACTNTEFYSEYNGERPSMIFIDASHRYHDVIVDIKWAVDSDIPIICGHDYSDDFPGVTRAVDETFGSNNVETVSSIWAFSNSSIL